MNIGEKIRHLRRERDITQETLAEYLSVSSKAISQWENSRTTPDISQLPVLANVFEVTVDELLGVDINEKEAKIKEYLKRGQEAFDDGKAKESVEILREGLAQYPNSYQLMLKLASCLYCSVSFQKAGTEVSALLDKILSECTDNAVRNEAVVIACRLYPKIGREEDAVRLAESMKGAASKLELLPEILQGREKFKAYRDSLFRQVNITLCGMFFYAGLTDESGNAFFSKKECMAIYEKILACAAIFFEEGDYMYEAEIVEKAAEEAARLCAAVGDMDKAIWFAEKCADACIQFDTYDWNVPYKSLLWRGFVFGGYQMGEHNHSYEMAERFAADDDFAILRENTRFDVILLRLRAAAK